jgi:hypothetical protein
VRGWSAAISWWQQRILHERRQSRRRDSAAWRLEPDRASCQLRQQPDAQTPRGRRYRRTSHILRGFGGGQARGGDPVGSVAVWCWRSVRLDTSRRGRTGCCPEAGLGDFVVGYHADRHVDPGLLEAVRLVGQPLATAGRAIVHSGPGQLCSIVSSVAAPHPGVWTEDGGWRRYVGPGERPTRAD